MNDLFGGLSLEDIQKLLDEATRLTPAQNKTLQQRAQALVTHKEREGTWEGSTRPHVEYQGRPVDWIVEKLEIPRETIQWSLYPEYQNCTCNTEICNPATRDEAGSPAHIWDGDKDALVTALNLLAQGKSVAISAATGTGKTFVIAACGTLYWLACYLNSIALSLAPKRDLLLKNMWKEIGKLSPKFKAMFPEAEIFTGQLRMLPGEGMQEVWSATAFGAGVGADEDLAQNLKGFHAARQVWVLEETPGIDQPKIETVIKTSTGEFNPIVALGNPEHGYDPLAMFGKRNWVTHLRISAYDYPNVVLDREVIPGARSRVSIARDLEDAAGNVNDPIYISQVRGVHPDQSEFSLIKRSWCEDAAKRYAMPEYRVGPLALGVDPSNSETFGKAAIARWQGACLTEVERRPCADANVLGAEVVAEAREQGIDQLNVGCDSIGNASGTINEAKRLGFYIRGLNGASKPEVRIDEDLRYGSTEADPDAPPGPVVVPEQRYANLRAQMYWQFREDLKLHRIALPNDPELFEELCVLQWDRKNGKIALMPKEDVIKKLKRSPDRADAAVYGNWVRRRRPLPNQEPPSNPRPNRAYDDAFDRLLEHMDQSRVAVSRRPF